MNYRELEDDITIDLIDHFYEEDNHFGRYPMIINDEFVYLIEAEFPNLRLIEKKNHPGEFLVEMISDNFTTDQLLLYARTELDFYKEEYNDLLDGLNIIMDKR